jgi:predicted permease
LTHRSITRFPQRKRRKCGDWTRAVLVWLVPIADPALRSAALLTGALPMLGIYTLLSQRHGHGAISAAALLVTTVGSFFTLSGLLWLLPHQP